MTRVGIRDVAVLAEVSLGTVSNFYNRPSQVSPEKRERIRAAIDTLGFVRNNAAGQLRHGRSALIAHLAPDISSPSFSSINDGAQSRAAENGLSIFVASSNGDRTLEDTYLSTFEQNRVDGILVSSRHQIEERLMPVRHRGTPIVLIGQVAHSPELPSVAADDIRGGELVGRHLIEAGRHRIAFIGGPFSIRQVSDRYEGLCLAIRDGDDVMVEVVNTTERSISEGQAIGHALARRPPSLRPDAVFCVNDLLAIGVMQALVRSEGITVPHEISVVGYDDTPFAAASLIPLTSVRAANADLGREAMGLLLGAINPNEVQDHGHGRKDAARNHIVFDPTLLIRESSDGQRNAANSRGVAEA